MSHPIRLLKEWWPATTCALVLLVLSTLTAPLELEYDDNGLGSLLFLINSVVGFFFLLPVTLSILSMEINGSLSQRLRCTTWFSVLRSV